MTEENTNLNDQDQAEAIADQLLREIDRRVRYLRKRLDEIRVVDYSPQQIGRAHV